MPRSSQIRCIKFQSAGRVNLHPAMTLLPYACCTYRFEPPEGSTPRPRSSNCARRDRHSCRLSRDSSPIFAPAIAVAPACDLPWRTVFFQRTRREDRRWVTGSIAAHSGASIDASLRHRRGRTRAPDETIPLILIVRCRVAASAFHRPARSIIRRLNPRISPPHA